jgi:hypothetical protein
VPLALLHIAPLPVNAHASSSATTTAAIQISA